MKVLIAYYSLTGKTEKMAEYIAEGIRFSGQEVVVKKMGDIKAAAELTRYDGCIFGSPTYSLDVPEPVKAFLVLAEKAGIEGKLGGAFGSYKHDVSYEHDAHAPAIIFDNLQRVCKMEPFELGSFNLKEVLIDTPDGIKACQDYGKTFGQKLL